MRGCSTALRKKLRQKSDGKSRRVKEKEKMNIKIQKEGMQAEKGKKTENRRNDNLVSNRELIGSQN